MSSDPLGAPILRNRNMSSHETATGRSIGADDRSKAEARRSAGHAGYSDLRRVVDWPWRASLAGEPAPLSGGRSGSIFAGPPISRAESEAADFQCLIFGGGRREASRSDHASKWHRAGALFRRTRVTTGIVGNIARPDGNVTGSTIFNPELCAKRLEILKEALPGTKRVGILLNPDDPVSGKNLEATELGAVSLNVQLQVFEMRRASDLYSISRPPGRSASPCRPGSSPAPMM